MSVYLLLMKICKALFCGLENCRQHRAIISAVEVSLSLIPCGIHSLLSFLLHLLLAALFLFFFQFVFCFWFMQHLSLVLSPHNIQYTDRVLWLRYGLYYVLQQVDCVCVCVWYEKGESDSDSDRPQHHYHETNNNYYKTTSIKLLRFLEVEARSQKLEYNVYQYTGNNLLKFKISLLTPKLEREVRSQKARNVPSLPLYSLVRQFLCYLLLLSVSYYYL